MIRALYDANGEPTGLGRGLGIFALLIAVASGLALLPALIIGPASAMLCGGPCSMATEVGVHLMLFSPLLLLISMICGWFAFRQPTWGLLLFTAGPAAMAATGFLLGLR